VGTILMTNGHISRLKLKDQDLHIFGP